MFPKINRSFRRRRTELIGDWSLRLQECDWILSFHGASLSSADIGRRSTDADLADLNDLLMDIDGQKLIEVSFDETKQEVMFHFDLGGEIRFSSSAQADGPHWSLYSADDLIFESGGENG
jgi:hypothetical protein